MSKSLYHLRIVASGWNKGLVGNKYELTRETTVLGRDFTCDIRIANPEVSRQHARITKTHGGYVIEDLHSTNGTYIEAEQLITPRVLVPGDVLILGTDVKLMFEEETNIVNMHPDTKESLRE